MLSCSSRNEMELKRNVLNWTETEFTKPWNGKVQPQAISLPSLVGITKIDLKKSAKKIISDPYNSRHLPRSRSFEVKFTDKVPLTPSNIPTKFLLKNQNRLGGKCKKCDFLNLKWQHLQNLEQLGPYFALHSGATQDMCLQNIIRDLCKIKGTKSRTKIKEHILYPTNVAEVSNQSNAYRSYTSCGT